MRRTLFILPLTLFTFGCGSLVFQGTSYSFRTTQEDPGLDDVYVGLDANFAVVEPNQSPRPMPVTTARRDPYDAWNTPVPFPDRAAAAAAAAGQTDQATLSRDELFLGN